jgi:hypothetical protein
MIILATREECFEKYHATKARASSNREMSKRCGNGWANAYLKLAEGEEETAAYWLGRVIEAIYS